MKKKFVKVSPGKGSAVEVKIIPGTIAKRYTYRKRPVKHKGKLMRQRYGWDGNRLVEIAFVPIKLGKSKKGSK